MKKALVVCLSPAFQSIMVFAQVKVSEVNRCIGNHLLASGKGLNVSRLLSSMGIEACSLTCLGGPRIQEFKALAERPGIKLSYVVNPDGNIRTCTTVIDSMNGTCTELVQEAPDADKSLGDSILSQYTGLLEDTSLVIITGSRPRGLDDRLYPEMARMAGSRPLILDIRGSDLLGCIRQRPCIIKPNLSEFYQTFFNAKVDESVDSRDLQTSVQLKQKELYDSFGVSSIISRGAFDLWGYGDEGPFTVPATKVKAVNTIGCGDALASRLAWAILEGHSFSLACSEASAFASMKAATILGGVG
jgi:fructose-1-phosphate kinase PfkB-like protein